MIDVLIKEPGKAPKVKKIGDTREDLEAVVGGPIEVIGYSSSIVIIAAKAGINAADANIRVGSLNIGGTVIVAGMSGPEFGALPKWDIKPMTAELRRWADGR